METVADLCLTCGILYRHGRDDEQIDCHACMSLTHFEREMLRALRGMTNALERISGTGQ